MTIFRRHVLVGGLGLLLPCLLFLSACSDDPILGPGEPRDDGGGSYSSIKRLAPADTSTADSSAAPLPQPIAPPENPQQF